MVTVSPLRKVNIERVCQLVQSKIQINSFRTIPSKVQLQRVYQVQLSFALNFKTCNPVLNFTIHDVTPIAFSKAKYRIMTNVSTHYSICGHCSALSQTYWPTLWSNLCRYLLTTYIHKFKTPILQTLSVYRYLGTRHFSIIYSEKRLLGRSCRKIKISSISVSHPRKSLVKGERFIRYERKT